NSNSNTNAWAKAGVMFRTSLDAGSAQAMVIVSAANGVSFQRRTTAGGTSVSTNVSGMLPPQWVRLDRSGNAVYAYQSHVGVTWGAAVGTATIAFPTSLYVGIAVTSHNNSALTTASVGTVVVSSGGGGGGGGGGSLPAPWLQSDIGAVGVAGTGQDTN